MSKPAHYNTLNKKYDNFIEYCNDAGFINPVAVADDIINNQYGDITYIADYKWCNARIVWGLLKTGIYYKNGSFYYFIGNTTFVSDLPMMLELVLGWLTDRKGI